MSFPPVAGLNEYVTVRRILAASDNLFIRTHNGCLLPSIARRLWLGARCR